MMSPALAACLFSISLRYVQENMTYITCILHSGTGVLLILISELIIFAASTIVFLEK